MKFATKSVLPALLAIIALVLGTFAAFGLQSNDASKRLAESCAEGDVDCRVDTTNPSSNPATAIKPERAPLLNDPRPNVVVVLVDDMRSADLRFMPKVNRLLGDRGVNFKNMITPNPLCCPARASLLTAQYTHNNGVLSNKGLYGGMQALKQPQNTLPVWLQRAGYNTAFFGKYLNGYGDARSKPIPAGWDWWDATGRGTYAYTHFQFANNGDPKFFDNDYITTRLRQRSDDKIRDFARERSLTGEPFYIFDSYVAPHGPIGEERSIARRVGYGPIPEPKYYNKFSNKINPSTKKPSYNVPIENYPAGKLRPRDNKKMQETFLNRIRTLASVDDAVANTVRTLKETGQYDNTVIMFMSDNGFFLGEHARYGKEEALEEAVRVPLLVAGPGFPKGQVSRRWATLPDVAATVASLAKATPGLIIDGKTFEGASRADRPATTGILVENGNGSARDASDAKYHYQGILLGQEYTYTDWSPGSGEELYDNRRDPFQLVNVIDNPRYAQVANVARDELAKIKDCNGVGACETTRNSWPQPTARRR